MNVLEKILEEIEEKNKIADDCNENLAFIDGVRYGLIEAKKIIRSHMNDGKDINVGSKSDWIPVENGLPEKSGWYLVQLSASIPHEDYAVRVVALYDGEEKVFMCYEKLIVAWQPLPEPYKGGKENE